MGTRIPAVRVQQPATADVLITILMSTTPRP